MDYFGDEAELTGVFRAARSANLCRLFSKRPQSDAEAKKTFAEIQQAYAEIQRSYGKRFSDRILGDADLMFGPTGRKVALHFPIDGRKIIANSEKPSEFVASFTGKELARVFSAYDKNSPIYQSIEDSVAQVISAYQANSAHEAIKKASLQNMSDALLVINRLKLQP